MRNPDNVVKVNTKLKDFFKVWLMFLKPYHRLTDRQIDVAASFLYHRYDLSKKITDTELLDKEVLSESVRREVREECDITPSHFLVTISALKKSGFISDNKLNPRYIPSLKSDKGNYFMLLYFQVE